MVHSGKFDVGFLLTAVLLLGMVRPTFAVDAVGIASAASSALKARHRAGLGCTTDMSHAARLAVLDDLTATLKVQLEKTPFNLKNDATRDKMGTFIAGSMRDDVPFISLDRWCWAEFYRARQLLVERDEAGAFESAGDWQVCLAATFPDRMELTRPYLNCFPGKPTRASRGAGAKTR